MSFETKIKRFFRMMLSNPNSPRGLIIRAEILEEHANDAVNQYVDAENCEKQLLYAKCLRELAKKKLSPGENKDFINKYMRPPEVQT